MANLFSTRRGLNKFTEFMATIIETHGKDLTQPSPHQGTPNPSPTPWTTTPAPAASTKAEVIKPKLRAPEKANDIIVMVNAQSVAAADDLFGLLADERRISSWARAPASRR